jgi:hypothetical protein
VCTPGQTIVCYAGPDGTEGVGACQAGQQTCAEDGLSFGPCVDEVVPAPESCVTADVDDDCDGALDCVGEIEWGRLFSGPESESSHAVALDSAGGVVFGGNSSGPIDFGGGVLASGGDGDAVLVKLDASGEHLWSRRFGDAAFQSIDALAIDADDAVVVSGRCAGTSDAGGGPIAGPGNHTDILLAKYDADGAHLWSRCFLGGTTWNTSVVAIAPGGDIILAAPFGTEAAVGGATFQGLGLDDFVLARFSADGEHLWSRHVGGPYVDRPNGLGVDETGHILVAGHLGDGVDLGGGPIAAELNDDFIAKYTADGDLVWAEVLDSPPVIRIEGLAIDGEHVILAGSYNGPFTIGADVLPAPPGNDFHGFVGRWDGDGAPLWGKSFPGAGNTPLYGVAVDAAGAIVLAARFSQIDYGGGPLVGAGNDAAIVKLSGAGEYLWARAIGGPGNQAAYVVRTDAKGRVAVTASASPDVDFGAGTLTGLGKSDIFVARLLP